MIITFGNNKSYIYNNAFGMEHDFYKGIQRPSIEIVMPISEISYNELIELLDDKDNIHKFTLTGDEIYNEFDNVTYPAPVEVFEYYNIKGSIKIDEDEISFKLYRKSNEELENEILRIEKEEAIALVDQLLIAMEG